jgi:hypothetical protein
MQVMAYVGKNLQLELSLPVECRRISFDLVPTEMTLHLHLPNHQFFVEAFLSGENQQLTRPCCKEMRGQVEIPLYVSRRKHALVVSFLTIKHLAVSPSQKDEVAIRSVLQTTSRDPFARPGIGTTRLGTETLADSLLRTAPEVKLRCDGSVCSGGRRSSGV